MFLKINIGGNSFSIKRSLLFRAKESFLAKFVLLSHTERLKKCDGYLEDTNEYFFERSTSIAQPVITYYQTGIIFHPPELCPVRFWNELNFWGVSSSAKASHGRKSTPRNRLTLAALIRHWLWNMTDEPDSGIPAKVFALLSTSFILISVAGLILSSLEEFQVPIETESYKENNSNSLYLSLLYSEYVCIAWFSFEFILGLCVSPDKLKFIKSPLNAIDVLTIMPFYVELSLSILDIDADKLKSMQGTMSVARFARTLRVCRSVRIFKLARYNKSLMVFGKTIIRCAKELSMLVMLLITTITFFSTLIYFLEKDVPDTKFNNILAACWWGVVTVTKVGYGDLVPQTICGKITASLAAVCGIVVLAFPISMMVHKFSEFKDELESNENIQ